MKKWTHNRRRSLLEMILDLHNHEIADQSDWLIPEDQLRRHTLQIDRDRDAEDLLGGNIRVWEERNHLIVDPNISDWLMQNQLMVRSNLKDDYIEIQRDQGIYPLIQRLCINDQQQEVLRRMVKTNQKVVKLSRLVCLEHLYPGCDVHHGNLDKSNNARNNLFVLTRKEHSHVHHRLIKPIQCYINDVVRGNDDVKQLYVKLLLNEILFDIRNTMDQTQRKQQYTSKLESLVSQRKELVRYLNRARERNAQCYVAVEERHLVR